MANQPETTSYDSGVYQIEATDPVDGGVGAITNSPILSLANRTNYLKKHLDDIEGGVFVPNGLAPLNSPALTGSPSAPTQAAADSSTKLSNTAFVQTAVNGAVTVSVAGAATTTLTAAQYGVAIIILTGAVTGNKSVVFPALTGNWQVVNSTTGAFTITLKTAAGSGVSVTQGTSTNIYGDGSNIGLQQTDFISPVLTGSPSAPKASQFATGSGLVNLDALKTRGNEFRSLTKVNSSLTLTALHIGGTVVVSGVGAATITLPPAGSAPAGAMINITSYSTINSTNTVASQGSDTINGVLNGTLTTATSFSILFGDTLTFVTDGGSEWQCVSNSSANFIAAQFYKGQSAAINGYGKNPGGLIFVWGQVQLPAYTTANTFQTTAFLFPLAFPNAVLNITSSIVTGINTASFANMSIEGRTKSGASVIFSSGQTGSTPAISYLAVGN